MNCQMDLINILKAMLSSALAWEDEHGMLGEVSQDRNTHDLTSISSPIHWTQDGQTPLKLIPGGNEDESTNSES